MTKKKAIVVNFSNENGGFHLKCNNLELATKVTQLVKDELEKPIPVMKEYYKLAANDKFYPLDKLEKEGDVIEECLAAGLVPKEDMKPCPHDIGKEVKDFATCTGECPLMGNGSGKPCKEAYAEGLVCKIHYYLKLKSIYTGKAQHQTKII